MTMVLPVGITDLEKVESEFERKVQCLAPVWWCYSSGTEHRSSYRTNQLVNSQGLVMVKLGEAKPAITQNYM